MVAEPRLGRAPVRHGVAVRLAGRPELRFVPVPLHVGVALQIESLLVALAQLGIEDELRRASRIPHALRLIERHVVAHPVLGLAGGEALQERRSAILERVEDGPEQLGGVRDRHLRDERGPVTGEKRLRHGLLLHALALACRAEGVHVASAEHRGRVRVLAAGVRVHLGVEHQRLHVRAVLQDHLRYVLIADVAHAAVSAHDPDLGHLVDLLGRHQVVGEVGEVVVALLVDHVVPLEDPSREPFWNHRPPCVVVDEALADQPADRRAVLEEGVHPGVGVGVVGRRRSVDRVAARVRRHRHDGLPVREPAVQRLQLLVVERLLPHDCGDGVDHLFVSDRPVGFQPRGRVRIGVSAESHERMRDSPNQQCVLLRIVRRKPFQACRAVGFERGRLAAQPIRLGVEDRPEVRLGHSRDRPEDALLATAGTCAVARHERVVIPAHHHQVAQRGCFRIGRVRVVVEAEVLLRCVRQQVEECRAGLVVGIDFLGLLDHLQRLVVPARRHAGCASLAEIRNEDREDPAAAWILSLGRLEDRVGHRIGERLLVDDLEELVLRVLGKAVQIVRDVLDDVWQRSLRLGCHRFLHGHAGTALHLRHGGEHPAPFPFVGHVVGDRSA